jgi:hypothetical protein
MLKFEVKILKNKIKFNQIISRLLFQIIKLISNLFTFIFLRILINFSHSVLNIFEKLKALQKIKFI